MPLQCDICEGIRIVPKLLEVATLRRNYIPATSLHDLKVVAFLIEALLNNKARLGL